jgi:hypothetical protein
MVESKSPQALPPDDLWPEPEKARYSVQTSGNPERELLPAQQGTFKQIIGTDARGR